MKNYVRSMLKKKSGDVVGVGVENGDLIWFEKKI